MSEARSKILTDEFAKLQADMNKAVEARQRLDAQLSENESVLKEFSTLTPNNTVFKMIGPVLVKQDQAEARTNVEKRLEFIRGEIQRVEATLKDVGTKLEKKKADLASLNAQLGAVPGAAPVVGA